MFRYRKRNQAIVVACSILTVSACGIANLQEDAVGLTGPGNVARSVAAAKPLEDEGVSAIARGLALALSNPGMRQQLKRDLVEQGRGREHKLLPRKYLAGPGASDIAAAVKQMSGFAGDSLARILSNARELELYMPVQNQRSAWNGHETVLVAYQLDKHSPIVAFDSRGDRVILSESAPPSMPVIALVLRELTAKEELLPAFSEAASMQLNPSGFARLCENPATCENGGSGGEGGPPNPNDLNGDGVPNSEGDGLYLVYSNISDLAEPWIRGNPEINLYMVGPSPSDPATSYRLLECRGEPYYDQNEHFWNGVVSIMGSNSLQNHGFSTGGSSPGARTFTLVMYEDDDMDCVVNDDSDLMIQRAGEVMGANLLIGFTVVAGCTSNGCGMVGGILALIVNITGIGQITGGYDDYLGTATLRSTVPVSYSDPKPTHLLVRSTSPMTINGGIKIVYHKYGS